MLPRHEHQIIIEHSKNSGFNVVIPQTIRGQTNVLPLWGQTTKLPTDTAELLGKINNASGKSLLVNGKETYIVLGPLAFVNGACNEHATLIPIAKEDWDDKDKLHKPNTTRTVSMDSDEDTEKLTSDWKVAHSKHTLPKFSRGTVYYSSGYRIECQSCGRDTKPFALSNKHSSLCFKKSPFLTQLVTTECRPALTRITRKSRSAPQSHYPPPPP